MDREKVIKALGICAGDNDFSVCINEKCPYIGGAKDGYCITNLERDALAMLKEQEEEIENLKQTAQSMMEGVCLLKEQEAVRPRYNAKTNWYECGACHYSMTSGMHCRGELIPVYKVGFCAKCGKAVKWND